MRRLQRRMRGVPTPLVTPGCHTLDAGVVRIDAMVAGIRATTGAPVVAGWQNVQGVFALNLAPPRQRVVWTDDPNIALAWQTHLKRCGVEAIVTDDYMDLTALIEQRRTLMQPGLRCLTVRLPWAWLIIHGGKDIENRSWKTDYRGPLAIHAGKSLSRYYYDNAVAMVRGMVGPVADTIPTLQECKELAGNVLGTVEVVGMRRTPRSLWYDGSDWGWQLANAQAITPVPAHGKLGLWNLQDGQQPLVSDSEVSE